MINKAAWSVMRMKDWKITVHWVLKYLYYNVSVCEYTARNGTAYRAKTDHLNMALLTIMNLY
jgi:hypothetical protein